MKDAKACRDCHHLTRAEACPACQGRDLTRDWQGLVVILDYSRSKLAEEMGIDHNGPFALKVR